MTDADYAHIRVVVRSTLAGKSRALIDAVDSLPLADHTQLYRAIDLELSQTRAAYLVFCLLPALDALNTDMSSTAAAARQGADHTGTLAIVKAGRASDINTEQLEGHIDPGAESVTRLFEHLAS